MNSSSEKILEIDPNEFIELFKLILVLENIIPKYLLDSLKSKTISSFREHFYREDKYSNIPLFSYRRDKFEINFPTIKGISFLDEDGNHIEGEGILNNKNMPKNISLEPPINIALEIINKALNILNFENIVLDKSIKYKNLPLSKFKNGNDGIKQIFPLIFYMFEPLIDSKIQRNYYDKTNMSDLDYHFYQYHDDYRHKEHRNAGRYNLLFIQQPELHLHPGMQSKIADLLLLRKELYMENKAEPKNLIIETHSEHFLRKLQILVAQKKLSPDEIGVYYFDREKDGTTVRKINLDENGGWIEQFPSGFFDESYNLVKELIKSRVN
ncbi:MAG: DUF3696 domain-containing protein [Ignavibacteriaceae bacterium]|nr:DUF3696 domain-containing protein [Ignavibacteriaceae bacterium]